MVQATVDKCEAFGVFVHWDGGKGLVPNSELGTPRGSDNRKTLPPGTQFKAQIVDIDDRGRYRLSRSAAERAEGASDYREYQRQMNKRMPPGKGFGTLGNLLRAKLEESEDESIRKPRAGKPGEHNTRSFFGEPRRRGGAQAQKRNVYCIPGFSAVQF